ncbi:hypothetical protein KQX54_001111 [Cotesia glomerata]|uniref:Ankyrin repeat protein n=1 Tax=Cotesia glomerata TaxID=32391 RepID=A0AAV7IWB3_COTGL|nr:hypothetical protein KQX54_001111 [Cotesia glomerata]
MALLQAIRAQHQEALDKHFNEAIETRNYTKSELPRCSKSSIPLLEKRLHGTVDYEDENNAGWGPLHLVVEDNNYDGATFLLENGADPDVETEDGTQPINISVDNKNVEMTKLLMSYGADSCGNKEAFKKAV